MGGYATTGVYQTTTNQNEQEATSQNEHHPGGVVALGEDRMQSAPLLLDPEMVTQVYQTYAAQLSRDRNAKIKDVL